MVQELKAIRAVLGFSQETMAQLLGTSKAYVSLIENDKKPFSKELYDRCVFLQQRPKVSREVDISIDWVRVRFKTLDFASVIAQVLKIGFQYFVPELRGGYSYDHQVSSSAIKVFYSGKNKDMGTMIELSGTGCREFELYLQGQNRTWFDFFNDCFEFAKEKTQSDEELKKFIKFPRLDIALDELYDEQHGNFDLNTLYKKVNCQRFSTKLKSFRKVEEFEPSGKGFFVSNGLSLYFGTRLSEIYFNFYQKDVEQSIKQDLSLDYIHQTSGLYNRYEIRLANGKATNFVEQFLEKGEQSLSSQAKALITSYVSVFEDETDRFGRMNIDERWRELFYSDVPFKFRIEPRSWSIEKSRKWVHKLASNIKFQSELDKLDGTAFTQQILNEAELSDRQKKLIDQRKEMLAKIKWKVRKQNEYV